MQQWNPRWLAFGTVVATAALTLAFIPLIDSIAARNNYGGDTPIISLSLLASAGIVLGVPWTIITISRKWRGRRRSGPN